MLLGLCMVHGYFHVTVAELNSYYRDFMAHKAQNISLAFHRKGLLTHALRGQA